MSSPRELCSAKRREASERDAPTRKPAGTAGPALESRGLSFDGMGNRALLSLLRSGRLQRKARVSQPGDPLEHDADRAADAVVSGTQPAPVARAHSAPPEIQRAATGEQQLAALLGLGPIEGASAGTPAQKEKPESRGAEIVGQLHGGNRLDDKTRALMESRFGESFHNVRIHTSHRAAETADSLHSRAFTVGEDIVFGDGEFAPETIGGQRLLAHELAHVVQQRQATGPVAGEHDAEHDASEAAHEVTSGGTPNVRERSAPGAVQKQEAEFKPKPVVAWTGRIGGEFGVFANEPGRHDQETVGFLSGPEAILDVAAYEHGGDTGHDILTVSIGARGSVTNKKESPTTRWPTIELHTYEAVPEQPVEPEQPVQPEQPHPPPPPPKTVPKPPPKVVPPGPSPKQPAPPAPPAPMFHLEFEPVPPPARELPFKIESPASAKLREALSSDPAKAPEAASKLTDQELGELGTNDRLSLLQAIAGYGAAGDANTLFRVLSTTPGEDAGALADSLNADNGKLAGELRAKLAFQSALQFDFSLMDLQSRRGGASLFGGSPPQFQIPPVGPDPNQVIWLGDPLLRPSWTKGLKFSKDDSGNTSIWTPELGLTSWDSSGKRLTPLPPPDADKIQRYFETQAYLASTGGKRYVAGKALDEAEWKQYIDDRKKIISDQANRKLENLDRFTRIFHETQTGGAYAASIPSHILGGRWFDEPGKMVGRTRQDLQIALHQMDLAQTPQQLQEAEEHALFAPQYGESQFYQYREDVYAGGERTITGIKVGAVALTAAVSAPVIFTTLGGATVVSLGGKLVVVGATGLGTGLLTGTMGGALESAHHGLTWENYGKGVADYFPVGLSYGTGFAIGGVLGPSTSLLRGAAIDASVSGVTGVADTRLHGGSWDESWAAGGQGLLLGGATGLVGRGLSLKSLPLRIGFDVTTGAGIAYVSGASPDEVYRQGLLSTSLGLAGGLGEKAFGNRPAAGTPNPAWEQAMQRGLAKVKLPLFLPIGAPGGGVLWVKPFALPAAPASTAASPGVPAPPPGMTAKELREANVMKRIVPGSRPVEEKFPAYDGFAGGTEALSYHIDDVKQGEPIIVISRKITGANMISVKELDVPDVQHVLQNVDLAMKKAYEATGDPVRGKRGLTPVAGTNDVYYQTTVEDPSKISIIVQVPGTVTPAMVKAANDAIANDLRRLEMPPIEVHVVPVQ
ncbi:MAG: DUF4157 domain-containing protein [Candidatus Sulfopaludibacter sp.]|nr:DUF4157 domain-containing protein [Candidatus Sulfopaludibacter sp.]